ncbi:MAG: hypothetical protein A4S09_06725 [Proteobacteria bacterium SG_bin7]|nr:MAG: hypothetical protein A4S09_06725 [Proteobacteria bacterium SG_bin7]
MATVNVVIPSVGESIVEANIGKLFVNSGDWVEKNSPIFEIETDKATVEVVAPDSGQLALKVNQGDTVAIGATAGTIDNSVPPPTNRKTSPTPTPTSVASKPSAPPPLSTPTPAVTAFGGGGGLMEVEMKGIGPGKRKAIREGKMPMPSQGPSLGFDLVGEQERKPMSAIRKKIAERLVYSQQSTATLTTFNEIDMSRVMSLREKLKDDFQNKNGIKLGFMSFFAKAMCYAISHVPAINGFIEDEEVVLNKSVHLSIAVSTDRGLVVPVIRNCQSLSYSQIEKEVARLADKARLGKLGIEEMMGGTTTLTNGGIFGSLLSTPILNPPQSSILGLHKTEFRPMAIAKEGGGWNVEVRPMMYVALSYDHRLIDGKESVTSLVKVKEYLETIVSEKDIT